MSDVMTDTLSILGTGVYLPPARTVQEVVSEAGGDGSILKGGRMSVTRSTKTIRVLWGPMLFSGLLKILVSTRRI